MSLNFGQKTGFIAGNPLPPATERQDLGYKGHFPPKKIPEMPKLSMGALPGFC
jgi:hypothetical protein